MYRCEEFMALMSADLDGMLTLEESDQLRAHLESCAECRALARELRIVHDCMCSLSAPVPDGFADAVMEKIRLERALEPKAAPLIQVKKKRWYVLGGLAAVLALTIWGAGNLHLFPSFGASGGSTMAAAPAAKDSASTEQTLSDSACGSASSAGSMLTATIISGHGSQTDTQAGTVTENPAPAMGNQQFSIAAQPEYGSSRAALADANEDEASSKSSITPLDAGYLVLNALYSEDVVQNAVTEENQDTVQIAVTVDGTAYTLDYTGLSENGASFEFTLSGKDGYQELWSVAVDGSFIEEQ